MQELEENIEPCYKQNPWGTCLGEWKLFNRGKYIEIHDLAHTKIKHGHPCCA